MKFKVKGLWTKKNDKYYFDLPKLAKCKLNAFGISEIVDSKIDTFKNLKYFSYRRSLMHLMLIHAILSKSNIFRKSLIRVQHHMTDPINK